MEGGPADSLSVADLVDAALATDDLGSDERSRAVGALQRRPDEETFAAALQMASGDTVRERLLGADILGQLGYIDPEDRVVQNLRSRAATVLIGLCDDDELPVAARAIQNLGQLADPRGVDAVLAHRDSDDADVRYAVAVALPTVTGWDGDLRAAGPAAPHIVDALIALSDDEDGDVRDWALF